MDREAQIEFLAGNEGRVRSYVSKWLENPAVREALERRPIEDRQGDPPAVERRRKVG